jgi:hypothetical protein
MTEEEKCVYEWIDNLPTPVPDWRKELPAIYQSFNATWFKNALPALSDTFVCEFQDMPRESAGIYIGVDDATKLSSNGVTVRAGIRINSRLECLSDHVKIALLHEMIHARGFKHNEGEALFQAAIDDLFHAGAYRKLL